MSVPTIAPYFPFRRIKIINQDGYPRRRCRLRFRCNPTSGLQPICHGCGQTAAAVHSWTRRQVRDLNMASTQVWLDCRYRKLFCPHCQWYPYRRSGAFSSILAGNQPDGALHLSVVSMYDRFGCRPAFGSGLENGQGHRQILSGARLRPAGFKRA